MQDSPCAPTDERSRAAALTSITVLPTADPRRVRSEEGAFLWVPPGWTLLPPGDAMMTRRVKAGGPAWTLIEKKGRKSFGKGVLAPAERIAAARASAEETRADPAYEEKLEAGRKRREREEAEYRVEFTGSVRAFLRFAPAFAREEAALAALVAAHATPVGSGTVARTERIPVEQRAQAAMIAWMRHQTTAYDDMRIERVKGARREVRRELAERSRALLDRHRPKGAAGHEAGCILCRAIRAAEVNVRSGEPGVRGPGAASDGRGAEPLTPG